MVHIRIQHILSIARSYAFSDLEEYGCLRIDMCFAIRLPGSKHPFQGAINFFFFFQKQIMKTVHLKTQ